MKTLLTVKTDTYNNDEYIKNDNKYKKIGDEKL